MKDTALKYLCASKAGKKLISYGKYAPLPDHYQARTPRLHTVEQKEREDPFAKEAEERLSNPPVLQCIRMDSQTRPEKLKKVSVSSSQSRRSSLLKNRDILSAELCSETLTSILSMSYFVVGTAAFANHSKMIFTKKLEEIEFCFKIGSVKQHNERN